MPSPEERNMTHFAFTVQVSGIKTDEGRYEDALYEAGCADALVAVVDGEMFLDFDREAPSFESAVASAKRDVAEAGGQVVKVEPITD
jgi:hypothetical protein